ncbi:hypothetical protein NBH13_03725 [Bifidobacterium sp. M3-R-103]|uniref:hypothetical protein n=1 Tax=Bifidobacterium sp. M3-R-103 TaxID=2949652 RepID=UPI00202EC148|nr:hypothetical protein [Bifidobacterium sp. M3-R-103]MCM0692349.1 hypothetical protein [Bifidobacterium sp. M3-R-103]
MSLPYESRKTPIIRNESRLTGEQSVIQTQHDGSAERCAVIIERRRAVMLFVWLRLKYSVHMTAIGWRSAS